MLLIKPLILIIFILMALLYPIIKNIIKKKKINNEIYERSNRVARDRLRRNFNERENDPTHPEYIHPIYRTSSSQNRTGRQQEQPQEEFLTEKDFEL